MAFAEIERVFPNLLTEAEERKLRGIIHSYQDSIREQLKQKKQPWRNVWLEMPRYRLNSAKEIVGIFDKLPGCCANISIKYIRILIPKTVAESLLKLFGFEKENENIEIEKEKENMVIGRQEEKLIALGIIPVGFEQHRPMEIGQQFGQNTPMLSELQQKVVNILERVRFDSNTSKLSTFIYITSLKDSDDDAVRYISELDGFEPAYINMSGDLVTRGTYGAVHNALAQLGFTIEKKHKFVPVYYGNSKTGRWVSSDLEAESVPNDLNALVDKIVVWADDKGIFEKATPQTQLLKAMEEMGELAKYLLKDDQHEVMDAIGDIVVCLTNLANMRGTTLNECVQQAYDVISKRKGKMINGAFVKEE